MFELTNGTDTILNEIASKTMKRKDIAKTYRLLLTTEEFVHWEVINRAIIERWSMSGLEWIKKAAWSGKGL